MPRKQYTIHYIYKTTNLINRKFYIGMHSTFNLDDEYLGSGKYLWRSIKKYSKENFVKEIIEFLPDRKSLAAREKEIVNEEFIKDPLCMNLKPGGEGGCIDKTILFKRSSAGGKKGGKAAHLKMKWLRENDPIWTKHTHDNLSNSQKGNHSFLGKTHTDEYKKLMSEKMKIAQAGERNSQFGTCWINDKIIAKKIKKEDLDEYLNQGWFKGRKI